MPSLKQKRAGERNIEKAQEAWQSMSPRERAELVYCFADQSVEEVLQNMGKNQVWRLPVVDRAKRLVGMVSLADVAMHAPAEKAGEALKGISKSGG